MLLCQNDNVYWSTAGRRILYGHSEHTRNNIEEHFTQILHELTDIKANHKHHEMDMLFRVTGPLLGESTAQRCISFTKGM